MQRTQIIGVVVSSACGIHEDLIGSSTPIIRCGDGPSSVFHASCYCVPFEYPPTSMPWQWQRLRRSWRRQR